MKKIYIEVKSFVEENLSVWTFEKKSKDYHCEPIVCGIKNRRNNDSRKVFEFAISANDFVRTR